MEELQNLVKRVKLESEKAGLLLNVKKTKVMKIQRTPTENGLELKMDLRSTDIMLRTLTDLLTLEQLSPILLKTQPKSKEELA